MASEYVGFMIYLALILFIPALSWWMLRRYGERITRLEWEKRFWSNEAISVFWFALCIVGICMAYYGEMDNYQSQIPWIVFALVTVLFITIPSFLQRQFVVQRRVFCAICFLWLYFYPGSHLGLTRTNLWCGSSQIELNLEKERSLTLHRIKSDLLDDCKKRPGWLQRKLEACWLNESKIAQQAKTILFEDRIHFMPTNAAFKEQFINTLELPDCHSSFTWHTLLTGLYARHISGTWKLWTPGGPIKEAIEKLEWRLDPDQPYPVE